MALKFNIDADKIAQEFKEFALEVKQDLEKGIAGLAAMTHAKVIEMANNELHSSRKDLLNSLGFEEIVDGVWVVSIDENGMWIEEGIEPNTDMKPGLLKNATKTSKDGNKYRSIPFEHTKAPSQMTQQSRDIVSILKANLKKENVPFKKIEKNKDGSPRTGKLHTFNFDSNKPTARSSTPSLEGVSIYQTVTKTGNVRRDILTFRTVSSGPASKDKWIHKGLQKKQFLDRSLIWAEQEWEKNILPEILSKWGSK